MRVARVPSCYRGCAPQQLLGPRGPPGCFASLRGARLPLARLPPEGLPWWGHRTAAGGTADRLDGQRVPVLPRSPVPARVRVPAVRMPAAA